MALKVTWDFQDPLSAVPELLALDRNSQIPLGMAFAGLSSYNDTGTTTRNASTLISDLVTCMTNMTFANKSLVHTDELLRLFFGRCLWGHDCDTAQILEKIGDESLEWASCLDDTYFNISVGINYDHINNSQCSTVNATPSVAGSWSLDSLNCQSQLTGEALCDALSGETYVSKATLLSNQATQKWHVSTFGVNENVTGADLKGYQQVWKNVDHNAVCNSDCGPDTRFGMPAGSMWGWLNFASGYPNQDVLGANFCTGFDCRVVGNSSYTPNQTLNFNFSESGDSTTMSNDFPEGFFMVSGPGIFGFNSYNDVRNTTYYRGQKKCMLAVFDGYGKWNKMSITSTGVKWLQRFQVSMFNEWSFAQCATVPQLYLGDIGPPICVTPGFLANVGKVNDDSNWVNNMPWFRPVPGLEDDTSLTEDNKAVGRTGFGIVALTDSPDFVIMQKEDLSSYIMNYEWYVTKDLSNDTIVHFNRAPKLNPCTTTGITSAVQAYCADMTGSVPLALTLIGWNNLDGVSKTEVCAFITLMRTFDCDGLISLPAWVASIGGAAHPRLIPSDLAPGEWWTTTTTTNAPTPAPTPAPTTAVASGSGSGSGSGSYTPLLKTKATSQGEAATVPATDVAYLTRSIYVCMMTGVDIPMKLHMGELVRLKNMLDIITIIPAYIDYYKVNVMDSSADPVLWCRIAPENLAFKGRYMHSYPLTSENVWPIFNMETSIPSQDMLDPNFAIFKFFVTLWDGMWAVPSSSSLPGWDGVGYCDIKAYGWQNDTSSGAASNDNSALNRSGTTPYYHSHVANSFVCPSSGTREDSSGCVSGDTVHILSAAPGVIYGDIDDGLIKQPVFNIEALANATARASAPPVGGGSFIAEIHILTGQTSKFEMLPVTYDPNQVFNFSATSAVMQAIRNQTVEQAFELPNRTDSDGNRLAGHGGMLVKYLLRQRSIKTEWNPPVWNNFTSYTPTVKSTLNVVSCFEFNKINPLWNGAQFCHFTSMGWYFDGWYDNGVKGLGQFSDGGVVLTNRCNTHYYGAFRDREYGWPSCVAPTGTDEYTSWVTMNETSEAHYGCKTFNSSDGWGSDLTDLTCPSGATYVSSGTGGANYTDSVSGCRYEHILWRNGWHEARDRWHWGKQMHVANEPTWIPKIAALTTFAASGFDELSNSDEQEAFIIMTTLNRCNTLTKLEQANITYTNWNSNSMCSRDTARGEVAIMSAKNLRQIATATMPVAFTLFLHGQYYPDWDTWGNLNTMIG